MLLIKQGLPVEEELVLCTVTNVQFHSVFVTLDEYNNRTGMIHISEVAPGRIRNIRDFVIEGKKVVCKILRINQEKGHIDLSLRRVNESQKQFKLNEIKQEQFAENILNYYSKQKKLDIKKLFNELSVKLLPKYANLFDAFSEVAKEEISLEKLGVDKTTATELTKIIKQRIKPPEVSLEAEIKIISYAPEGIEIIKSLLKKEEKIGAQITYKGGGSYRAVIKSEDYKKADKILSKMTESLLAEAKTLKLTAEVAKLEK